jgi:pimeloyl-ACP methyl ester carboxylesterase
MRKEGVLMAWYIMVHGGDMGTETWNRLSGGEPVHTPNGRMGARVWDTVIPVLKAQGHSIIAPALEDEHTTDLTGHIEQVCALMAEQSMEKAVMVAHSYGGMVITGIAARMAAIVSHLVYIDAAFPDPGQSLFDLIKSGGSDPKSFVGLEPAPPYVEKLQFDVNRINALPKTYVLCTESEFAPLTRTVKKKVDAGKGWSYLELPTCHVPMATMPERLAQILLKASN